MVKHQLIAVPSEPYLFDFYLLCNLNGEHTEMVTMRAYCPILIRQT